MRLLIISGMPHYLRDEIPVGWGPTVQEIDELATLFEEVRHVAMLHRGRAPASALPYTSNNVTFVPVPAAGGPYLLDKLRILLRYPEYLATILRELFNANVVHVRCPDNISLLAIVALSFCRQPKLRWVKYAGNWRPMGIDPWSYRFQRWWLKRRFHRGVVTVNGLWPRQPAHVLSFINPCLTNSEIAESKVNCTHKVLTLPFRCIFVGRVVTDKGIGQALGIFARLKAAGYDATLDIVGDGPDRSAFQAQAHDLQIRDFITFHGWLPRTALPPLYQRSHFLLLPSASEGWPKVLSEAMAYGVVPLAGNVGCISQFLERFQVGRSLPAAEPEAFFKALLCYIAEPPLWKAESDRAIEAARLFTYRKYLDDVRSLLKLPLPFSDGFTNGNVRVNDRRGTL